MGEKYLKTTLTSHNSGRQMTALWLQPYWLFPSPPFGATITSVTSADRRLTNRGHRLTRFFLVMAFVISIIVFILNTVSTYTCFLLQFLKDVASIRTNLICRTALILAYLLYLLTRISYFHDLWIELGKFLLGTWTRLEPATYDKIVLNRVSRTGCRPITIRYNVYQLMHRTIFSTVARNVNKTRSCCADRTAYNNN